MLRELLEIDTSVFRWINGGLGWPGGDSFMRGVSSPWPWVAIGVLFLAVALWRRSLTMGKGLVLVGVAIGCSDSFCYQILKPWVSRPRPCYALKNVRLVLDWCGGDFGFPSNHAANAMAIAVCLAWLAPRRWAGLAFGLALLVGFSRIYLGVHYPLDVLGAYGVGASISLGEYWLVRRFLPSWISTPGKDTQAPTATGS